MLSLRVEVTIMSGVEDGQHLNYSADNGDGQFDDDQWTLSIGRREDSDVCLRHDMFVSRLHAYLRWQHSQWWLIDCDSTNGTYTEQGSAENPVKGTIAIAPGEMFRVGRTWLRIEAAE